MKFHASISHRAVIGCAGVALLSTMCWGCDNDQSETKYNEASSEVVNHVTFDGVPQSYRPPRRQAPVEVSASEVNPSIMGQAPARPSKLKTGRGAYDRATAASEYEAEPKPQQIANSNQFADYGVNQMIATADDPLSTFGVDVDTGAYTVGRRMLNHGQLPPAAGVRVEEYLNYFRYSYPDPDSGVFSVNLEAAPSPFTPAENRKILRIGVQGKRMTRSNRKPVHLTFLVDVSGSMLGADRIDLAKKSLKILTQNLRERDTVAISTYASRVEEVLAPTSAANNRQIMEAVDRLRAGGGTAMGDGISLAYKLAMQGFKPGEVNRVVILSDGDANVGAQSHEAVLQSVRSYVEEGITLSTIGFGMGNYKEVMMEQLANKGNGNYYYIDTEEEARKVFGEQLDGTLQTIAKDVKIQVEFEPEAVVSYRLMGYENRDIAHKDFRNDRVDAGEIGAGHTVTALYEVVLSKAAMSGALDNFATVRVRHKLPEEAAATEQAFSFTRQNLHQTLAAASKDFQFITAVAGFAEILRESEYATNLNLALIEELARGSSRPDQKMRQEFIGLVQKARRLKKG